MVQRGVEMLNVDRQDHLSLHSLLTQVTSLSACWETACEKRFTAETLTQFSRVLHDVAKLSEEQHYSQVYELVCEMESAAIALGRRKEGALNDQVLKYMGSCVTLLGTLCHRLMDDALNRPEELADSIAAMASKSAKRVYFLDEYQQLSQGIAIDLRSHGYQVLSFRSTDDLRHAIRFREPIAIAVFLPSAPEKDSERTQLEQQDLLQAVIAYGQGRVPCIAVGQSNDDAVSRMAAAEAGANSYYVAPVDIAALACELYSLHVMPSAEGLKTVLVTDSDCTASMQVHHALEEAEFDVETVHSGGEMIRTLIERLPSHNPVDAIVIFDRGNEALLRQSFALLRQDATLEHLPLFVISDAKVHHSEHFLRLIQMGAMGHFSMKSLLHKDVSTPLLLKIQSNTQRHRRLQAKQIYAAKVESETGMLTPAGFEWHCQEVLNAVERLDNAPPHIVVLKLMNVERFSQAVGISDENLRAIICHGLLSLLSAMDRVISHSVDTHTLFLAQVDKSGMDQLLTKCSEWLSHFSAQYSAGETLTGVPGWSVVSEGDVEGAMRNARSALEWQLAQRGAKHSAQSSVSPAEASTVNMDARAPVVKLENLRAQGARGTTGQEVVGNWSSRVKNAIKKRCLNLVFQPIVSLDIDDRERYEVLLRLNESGEEILPGQFMKGIQDAALINYIDRWVITMALKELRQANRHRDKRCVFFIKLTGQTVADRSFVPWLKKALESSKVAPTQCVFELPEAILLESFAVAKDAIRRVRDLGASVSVSRFGTHEQSVGLLEYFEVDYVKLDQQVTCGEGDAEREHLRMLIQEAKRRHVEVLAGFVEDTQSLMSVIQTGVGLVSGDFLQPPDALRQFDFAIDL